MGARYFLRREARSSWALMPQSSAFKMLHGLIPFSSRTCLSNAIILAMVSGLVAAARTPDSGRPVTFATAGCRRRKPTIHWRPGLPSLKMLRASLRRCGLTSWLM